MTGPEHAARAEALLCGDAKWPSGIPDRIAAANGHALLAAVSLLAQMATELDDDQHRAEALSYGWRTALPLLCFVDDAPSAHAAEESPLTILEMPDEPDQEFVWVQDAETGDPIQYRRHNAAGTGSHLGWTRVGAGGGWESWPDLLSRGPVYTTCPEATS